MCEMKDSGIEWIGKIPNKLNIYRNKYLIYYEKGKNPSNTNTDKIGMPYIGASNLDDISGECQYSIFTTDTNIPQCNYDDVLILWDGARAGLIGTNHKGAISSTIINAIPNKSINKRFWYWYLKGFEKYLYDCVNGTTIPHMNRKYIEDIQMLSWSYDKQTIIANYLDNKCAKIDRYIEKQQQIIEKLKEYKQAIITEAVTKGLDPDVKMKDSGIEWIGQVPYEWSVTKASRVITQTQNGLTRRDLDISAGNIVLKLKNINSDGAIDYTEINRITLTEKEIETYGLKNGDFLFVRVNGSKNLVGKCAIYRELGETVAYNDHIIRVRLNDLCNKEYFQWYLLSQPGKREIDLHTSTAAGQFTISGEGLKDLAIVLPPINIQYKVVCLLAEKCKKIDTIIVKKHKVIKGLIEYKKSIIYEAVTGKLEV